MEEKYEEAVVEIKKELRKRICKLRKYLEEAEKQVLHTRSSRAQDLCLETFFNNEKQERRNKARYHETVQYSFTNGYPELVKSSTTEKQEVETKCQNGYECSSQKCQ
jgi:exonuclease VII large subunit